MRHLKRRPSWLSAHRSDASGKSGRPSLHAVVRDSATAGCERPAVPGYEILGELDEAVWASSTRPDNSVSIASWR